MKKFLFGLLLGLALATAEPSQAKHYGLYDYRDSVASAAWDIAGSLRSIKTAQWQQVYWAKQSARRCP